ncbi:MAG: cytidylate kinase-like family protein [Kiritimatiellae bacterium]|nr:cytidylate kinase-like family protein [Kiritimatiellia bacterium]
MHQDTIVTIGRQFGAGGVGIGRLLAESLGVPFYDRELLARAAETSGLAESLFEHHDEKPADALLLSSWGSPYPSAAGPSIGQQVCLAQFQAIRDIAAKGGCVIVGSAADFVLDGRPHLVRVFLHADLASRVARVAEREGIPEAKARKLVRTADRRRAAFYNYFTDRKWGDTATYDLCLDTGRVTPEQAVAVGGHADHALLECDVAAGRREAGAGQRDAAADARRILSARGGGGSARERDVSAGSAEAASDARSILSARGGDGAARDGDVAADGLVAGSNARPVGAARGVDDAARNGDGAVGALLAGADARRGVAADGGDGAARDGDVSAGTQLSGADARGGVAARGDDGAALDDDVAAGQARGAASPDARAVAVAAGIQRAVAPDDERLARRDVEARDVRVPAAEVVDALEDDGCAALAGDAAPDVVRVGRDVGDAHVAKRHGGAVGDEDAGVGAAGAGKDVAVLQQEVPGLGGDEDGRRQVVDVAVHGGHGDVPLAGDEGLAHGRALEGDVGGVLGGRDGVRIVDGVAGQVDGEEGPALRQAMGW